MKLIFIYSSTNMQWVIISLATASKRYGELIVVEIINYTGFQQHLLTILILTTLISMTD